MPAVQSHPAAIFQGKPAVLLCEAQDAGTEPIGLNFDAPILHYAQSQPKKNLTRLELAVRTQEDSYLYTIEVFDTGEAGIRVRSQNRDPISFEGNIVVE